MTDLRERFEAADEIPAPDLWASVLVKVSHAAADPAPGGLRLVRKSGYPSRRRLVSRKVLTIAAAFVIALAAAGLLVRAFRPPSQVPVNQPPLGIFAPVRGWIAELDRSGRLVASDPAGGQRSIRLPGERQPVAWSPDGRGCCSRTAR